LKIIIPCGVNLLPSEVEYLGNSVPVPKGRAVSEVKYDIKDQNGVGKEAFMFHTTMLLQLVEPKGNRKV
jgi:hypothetical protein